MTPTLRDQLQSALGSSYTVERELGGGGMARVFLAEERRFLRRVVVKVLSPELAADVSTERFEREIRMAAKLQDPRIVPVLSAGEAAGLPFYTMPFIDGMSLRDRMKEGPVPIASAVSILRDIALALEYAHENGIVHRDIKPENILITARARPTDDAGGGARDGRIGTAVVTDFGIAKALVAAGTGGYQRDGAAPAPTLTQVGVSLGTPAYMAPEQAAGDAIDHRADLYAWGVVAYELLSGSHPFGDRTTAGALVAAHIRDVPAPLATRSAAISPALASMVDRTLAKDPAARPASAAEIVRALDAAASHRTVRRAPSWLGRAARAVVAVGVVAAAATVVARGRGDPGVNRRSGRASGKSIAVLPFENTSTDTSDAYFAEGMSDELTTALGAVPNVRIASRGAVARYRDSTAVAAGRALRVDAVLAGKVSRRGDKLHVSAYLTNSDDATEVWSRTFDRRVAEVFDVQDEIARTIVDSLRVALGGQSSATVAAPRGTTDLEAYQLYLKGRYAWSRRGRDLLSAVSFYRQAIARDSTFARAYAGLAMAYTPMMVFGVARGDSVLPLAETSALHALRLDSTSTEAHLALASVRKMQWRWSEAEAQFRAAIASAPGDATAHQWYGTLLYSLGRVDEAVAQLVQARDLDQVSAALGTDVAYGLYAAGRYDEALAEARRTVALDTTLAISYWLEGLMLLTLDRPDSALTALTTAGRVGDTPDARPLLVRVYRSLGRTRDADTTYATLVRSYLRGKIGDRDMAIAAVAAGDLEAALRAVQRAIRQREPIVTEYSLPCDPLFDRLKTLPEFTRLLTAVGMRVCAPRR